MYTACRITYDSYKFNGIGVGDYTYGLIPTTPENATGGIKLSALEADRTTPGCFLYNVPPASRRNPNLTLSQIADMFGLGFKLPELVQNNTARGLFAFDDVERQKPVLDVPLNGRAVQLCYTGKYITLCMQLAATFGCVPCIMAHLNRLFKLSNSLPAAGQRVTCYVCMYQHQWQ